MSDSTVQVDVTVSTADAEKSFDRLAATANRSSISMAEAGAKAGQAVDEIGKVAKESGEKFTKAESVIVTSLKRLAKEAAQSKSVVDGLGKIDFDIAARGLDPAKFRPMIDVVQRLQAEMRSLASTQATAAAAMGGTGSASLGGRLQNTAYQMQDFIVQVNGGTDAMRALSMQLPQMLVGFGAVGAGIGVVAAMLPAVMAAFGGAANEGKKFSDAMSDFDKAIGDVGSTVKTFDMEKLYEQFNASSAAVRAATIEQVKFQQEYIKTTQLVAEKKFGETLSGLGNYGTLDKMLGAYGNSGAENLAKELGIQLSVAQELLPILKGLKAGTEDIGLAFEKAGQKLLAGNAKSVELAATMSVLAKSQRDAAAASSAASESIGRMTKAGATDMIAFGHAAKEAKIKVQELVDVFGSGSYFTRDKDTAAAIRESFEFENWAYRELAKNAEDYAKAADKAAQEDVRRLQSLEAKALAMEDEVRVYGLTEGAIQRTIIARLEEDRARAASTDSQERTVELLDAEIERRQRIAAAADSKDALDANKAATDKMQKDWERMHEQLGQSLTDELMRGGKDAGELLQNYFKTLVLRPLIQGAVNVGMNAVGLGGSSASGGGFDLFGTASTANSAYNLFSGGSSLYTGFATSSLGSSLGLSTAYVDTLGGTVGLASGGTSLTALGSALPWLGLGLAIASMLDDGGGPKSGGDAVYRYTGGTRELRPDSRSLGTSLYGPSDANASMQEVLGVALTGLESMVADLGGTLDGLQLGLGYDADPQGDAESRSAYHINGVKVGGFDGDQAGIQLATSNMMLAALDAIDLNNLADSYLDSLDIGELSADAAQQALLFVQATGQIIEAFGNLGISASNVTLDLINALGGIDAAGAKLGAYYQTYYTEQERIADLTESLSGQFDALNLTMPETKVGFRSLVETLDLSTDSGRAAYGALMNMAPAFAVVADATAEASAAMNQAMADILRGRTEWQERLDILTGKRTETEIERQRDLASTTDVTTLALMRQVFAQEDLATSAKAAREALVNQLTDDIDALVDRFGDLAGAMAEIDPQAETLVDAWRRTTSEIDSLVTALDDLTGTTPDAITALRNTYAMRDTFSEGVGNAQSAAESTRIDRMSPAARSAFWAQREGELWAGLGTSTDKGATISQIMQAFSNRRAADWDVIEGQYAVDDTQRETLDKQLDAWRDTLDMIERAKDMVSDIDQWISDIATGDLSALNLTDQLSTAAGTYASTLAQAQALDPDAMSAITGNAQAYLSEAQGYYGGATADYASIYRQVTGDLASLGIDYAGMSGTTAETEIGRLTEVLEGLGDIPAEISTAYSETTEMGYIAISDALAAGNDYLTASIDEQTSVLQDQVKELRAIKANQEAQITQQAAALAELTARLEAIERNTGTTASNSGLDASNPYGYHTASYDESGRLAV